MVLHNSALSVLALWGQCWYPVRRMGLAGWLQSEGTLADFIRQFKL